MMILGSCSVFAGLFHKKLAPQKFAFHTAFGCFSVDVGLEA